MSRSSSEIQLRIERAYDAVSFSEAWGFLSLSLFAASLSTRLLVRLLPRELQGWNQLPPLVVTAVPFLAGVGLIAAIVGGRGRSTTCRFGFVLNLVVLGLSLLLLGAFAMWRLAD